MAQPGRIESINVSQGGVPKRPVAQAQVSSTGLAGDRQNNLEYHGGPDRAVCLWSLDVIHTLQQEGHSIAPGSAGENLTLSGLDWATLIPGTQLELGPALRVEITDYAAPCRQNMHWFADRRFSRISQKHYPGSSRLYGRVLAAGTIQVGDRAAVVEG
ncbi:MAG: MOSC domain-containing protein [Nodosilinea sp.]